MQRRNSQLACAAIASYALAMTTPSESQIELRAGDAWTYRAPEGFENSRLVIGAVVRFADQPAIVCVCVGVTAAPQKLPDGSLGSADIPLIPMTEGAVAASIVAPAGVADPPPGFRDAFDAWQQDDRGLTVFTVPFEGLLDRMIALQMAEIVGEPGA
jgi:hypothetical protein